MNCFESYYTVMDQYRVRRMGVAECGSNGRLLKFFTKIEPFFKNREQSDAEHCFGAIFLAHYIINNYKIIDPEKEVYVLIVLLLHELGEGKSGDVADDGRRDGIKKDKEEFEIVENFISTYFSEYATILMPFFKDFFDKSGEFGEFVHMIDKLEAVLFNLYLERNKRTGSIKWKLRRCKFLRIKGPFRDPENVKITKSDRPADVWACGYASSVNKDKCVTASYHIFLEIMQSAAFCVRGEEMAWANESPFDIL